MFENYWKSRIQHCERSELWYTFGQKFIKNAKIGPKHEFFGQTVLPDRTKLSRKCQKWKIQMRHFETTGNSEDFLLLSMPQPEMVVKTELHIISGKKGILLSFL